MSRDAQNVCEITIVGTVLKSDAHDLEVFNSGSELGGFQYKNLLTWM